MSKSERSIPYLREIATLLNSHRDIKKEGGWKIERDGTFDTTVWVGGSGVQDVRMREEMMALREQLQLEAEKIDWLLSLW